MILGGIDISFSNSAEVSIRRHNKRQGDANEEANEEKDEEEETGSSKKQDGEGGDSMLRRSQSLTQINKYEASIATHQSLFHATN